MKKQSTTIISIILLIIIAILAVANTAPVEVNLLFTRFQSPLILLPNRGTDYLPLLVL